MGVSKRTVANQMSLALSDLRVLLRPFLPEFGVEGEAIGPDATTSSEQV